MNKAATIHSESGVCVPFLLTPFFFAKRAFACFFILTMRTGTGCEPTQPSFEESVPRQRHRKSASTMFRGLFWCVSVCPLHNMRTSIREIYRFRRPKGLKSGHLSSKRYEMRRCLFCTGTIGWVGTGTQFCNMSQSPPIDSTHFPLLCPCAFNALDRICFNLMHD